MVVFLVTFFVLMLIGVPICFCMLGSSALYIIVNDISARIIVEKFCTGPNSFTLLAIPFFILAANLMNNGGVTDRMFTFCPEMGRTFYRRTWTCKCIGRA